MLQRTAERRSGGGRLEAAAGRACPADFGSCRQLRDQAEVDEDGAQPVRARTTRSPVVPGDPPCDRHSTTGSPAARRTGPCTASNGGARLLRRWLDLKDDGTRAVADDDAGGLLREDRDLVLATPSSATLS